MMGSKKRTNNHISQSSLPIITDIAPVQNLNRPIQQDAKQYASPESYIKKSLPPVHSFNPLTNAYKEVIRPEYIIGQKNMYSHQFSENLKFKGFQKRKGEFERYNEILSKNKALVSQIHTDPQPTKEQIKRKQKYRLPTLDYSINSNESRSIYLISAKKVSSLAHSITNSNRQADSRITNETIQRYLYLNHDNRYFNKVQQEIDTDLVKSLVVEKQNKQHKKLMKPLSLFDNPGKSVNDSLLKKQILITNKLQHNDYDVSTLDQACNEEELQDIVDKVNYLDRRDQNDILGQLSDFSERVKNIRHQNKQTKPTYTKEIKFKSQKH